MYKFKKILDTDQVLCSLLGTKKKKIMSLTDIKFVVLMIQNTTGER